MDGVLVNVSGSYRRAIEETAEELTGKPTPAGAVQRFKDLGGYNNDWKLTAAIVAEAGVDVSYEAVITAFQKRYKGDNWDGLIAGEPAIIDGAKTLGALAEAGYAMALVTGRPDAEARWTLARFEWTKFFPVVIGMEAQDGKGKPDPFPLTKAMSLLATPVEPSRAVYVGDTGDDMIAARAAGMFAVGVVPPYIEFEGHAQRLRECGAHEVLRHPDEIVALVSRAA
ncbi:HAD superfamily hydrolase [Pavlovales sp. CCMP2436]|nr:HAD superfamily hydrolase [Pavlovales sp. CCMP2436]